MHRQYCSIKNSSHRPDRVVTLVYGFLPSINEHRRDVIVSDRRYDVTHRLISNGRLLRVYMCQEASDNNNSFLYKGIQVRMLQATGIPRALLDLSVYKNCRMQLYLHIIKVVMHKKDASLPYEG